MTLPFGMDRAEFLDCLGPSWADMSTAQRLAYPRLLPVEESIAPAVLPVPLRARTAQGQALLDRFAAEGHA